MHAYLKKQHWLLEYNSIWSVIQQFCDLVEWISNQWEWSVNNLPAFCQHCLFVLSIITLHVYTYVHLIVKHKNNRYVKQNNHFKGDFLPSTGHWGVLISRLQEEMLTVVHRGWHLYTRASCCKTDLDRFCILLC